MRGVCPHCGGKIELLPEIHGDTIVVNHEEKNYVVKYPNGFCKRQKGYEVHHCQKTGEDGHVVR